MCANALMSFDVTFKNSDVWLSPWCLLIMYSPGTFWLSGGLVGFYQLCWFVVLHPPHYVPAQNYYPGIRIMHLSELDGTVFNLLLEDL